MKTFEITLRRGEGIKTVFVDAEYVEQIGNLLVFNSFPKEGGCLAAVAGFSDVVEFSSKEKE
jgi:hypothetical protein